MRTVGHCQAIAALSVLLATTVPALAQTDASRISELEAKTAALADQLVALRAELQAARGAEVSADAESLRKDVANAVQTAQRAEKVANEWKDPIAVTHIAGYAAAGYASQDNGTDAFNVANFNPIFHFQYGDRILWESELEVQVQTV